MQPKRLLMISTDRKIFEQGSEVRARQAEYAKDWDEVHIVVFDKKKEEGKWKIEKAGETVISPNCWAYPTKSWTKFMYPFDAMRMGRFFIEKRGITNITCQDASLTAMAGSALKKQFNIPLEIQVHNDIGSPNFTYNLTNRIRKSLALSYLPKADHIRVVSKKIKGYLVDTLRIGESKIEVRPISVDEDSIKSSPILPDADLRKKYPQFDMIALVAARLEPEKNVELAIKAWAHVKKEVPKAGLVIVGSGSQEAGLKSLVQKLDLGQTVIFESWVSRDTLISYYKTSDLFLVTSLFEGYGMALVEARAAGCGIISTDVGVAGEIGATIVGWTDEDVARGVIDSLRM